MTSRSTEKSDSSSGASPFPPRRRTPSRPRPSAARTAFAGPLRGAPETSPTSSSEFVVWPMEPKKNSESTSCPYEPAAAAASEDEGGGGDRPGEVMSKYRPDTAAAFRASFSPPSSRRPAFDFDGGRSAPRRDDRRAFLAAGSPSRSPPPSFGSVGGLPGGNAPPLSSSSRSVGRPASLRHRVPGGGAGVDRRRPSTVSPSLPSRPPPGVGRLPPGVHRSRIARLLCPPRSSRSTKSASSSNSLWSGVALLALLAMLLFAVRTHASLRSSESSSRSPASRVWARVTQPVYALLTEKRSEKLDVTHP